METPDSETVEKIVEALDAIKKITEKKPPVLIAKLTPEQEKQWEDVLTKAHGLMVEATKLRAKAAILGKRFMMDMDDAYGLHTQAFHIHNGAIYKGRSEEVDHKDEDAITKKLMEKEG